jgi:hypothetical protein
MNEPEKPKKGWGWLQWGVVAIVCALITVFGYSLALSILDITGTVRGVRNSAYIVGALKLWAYDNNGDYPDSKLGANATANAAFRQLFIDDVFFEERRFGSVYSPYVPDGEIGIKPNYDRALEPGENHWMFIGGLNSESPGYMPMIFENALDASWPPKWKNHLFIKKERGRTWRKGTVVVAFMDNSVNTVQLQQSGEYFTLPDSILHRQGEKPFTPLRVLDIEEKK